jgi:hypothetical protein
VAGPRPLNRRDQLRIDSRSSDPAAPAPATAPIAREQLIALLEQLREEIDALFEVIGRSHDRSRS